MSEKEQFLKTYEAECKRTMKVLRAFPAEKSELKPHDKLRTARDLAFAFATESGLGIYALQNKIGTEPMGEFPEAPASWQDVLTAVEEAQQQCGDFVRGMSEEELNGNVKFFSGPNQLGDWRALDLCWHLLHDQIHHRGQLTVYLRLAGGKLPSVYGPTADEPWM